MDPSPIPLLVCIFNEPARNRPRTAAYPHYLREILDHAGICYECVDEAELPEALERTRLLVTAGDAELPPRTQKALYRWVHEGGGWLAIGACCGMGDLFGVEVEAPAFTGWGAGTGTLGEGYLDPISSTHPILNGLTTRLHFFNGTPVRATGAEVLAAALDAHQRETDRAALCDAAFGKGRGVLIAADVTGAVVHIQQGRAITRDGASAPDGTAPSCDGVLKSDDGIVLDYLFDRQPVAGADGLQAFLEPQADHWRALVLRAVFYLALEREVALPVLWLYPYNAPALGHISHDTDGNDPDCARRLLRTLDQAGISSTWCTICPGYGVDIIEAIRNSGHELAMHYDAVSDDWAWGEDRFHTQFETLRGLFNQAPTTNKNHYLRWEGDTAFFQWCAARGIQLDQSKGPSKTGQAGFPFGTSHPYFPLDPRGNVIDVLELPTQTQDLCVFGPEALATPLLEGTLAHYGIYHLLFHPGHIAKPGVAEALVSAVERSRRQGLVWWTAARINAWERARRQVQWRQHTPRPKGWATEFTAPPELAHATILWLGAEATAARVNHKACNVLQETRWGFPFSAVVMPELGTSGTYRIELDGAYMAR